MKAITHRFVHAIFAACALLLFGAAPSEARPLTYPAISLWVETLAAADARNSWEAVAEMAVHYRNPGVRIPICQLSDIAYGKRYGTCCRPDTKLRCNGPVKGLPEVGAVVRAFGANTIAFEKPDDETVLYALFTRDIPVIMRTESTQADTHLVILHGLKYQIRITGYHENGMPKAKYIPMVMVKDPLGILPPLMPFSELQAAWAEAAILDYLTMPKVDDYPRFRRAAPPRKKENRR